MLRFRVPESVHPRRRRAAGAARPPRADAGRNALFSRQLADFLAYAEQVQQVDTSGIAPTSHAIGAPTRAARGRGDAVVCSRELAVSAGAGGAPGGRTVQGTTSDRLMTSALEIRDAIRSGRTSTVEVCRSALDPHRRRRTRRSTRSTRSMRMRALARAAALDARRNEDGHLPLFGVPVALKDNLCTRGMADHCRLAHPRSLRPAVRRDGRRTARSRRGRHHRQDQLRRVRDGLVDRVLGVRSDAEPMVDRSHAGRIERRLGGSRRGPPGSARARLRHRRIDPPARCALRRRRAQADVRARLALRAARVRVVTGSDRPADDDRRGRRRLPVGHRRPRCARRDVVHGTGGGLRRDADR